MRGGLFLKIVTSPTGREWVEGEAEDWEKDKTKSFSKFIVCESWGFDAKLQSETDDEEDDDEDKPKDAKGAEAKSKTKKKKKKPAQRMAYTGNRIVDMGQLDFKKQPDTSTTTLLIALRDSKIYPSAEFTLMEELTGSGAEPFKLILSLTDVKVAEYKLTGNSGENDVELSETWKLEFKTAVFKFGQQGTGTTNEFKKPQPVAKSTVAGNTGAGAGAGGSVGPGGAAGAAAGGVWGAAVTGNELVPRLGSFEG